MAFYFIGMPQERQADAIYLGDKRHRKYGLLIFTVSLLIAAAADIDG